MPELWIVDVNASELLVYREPREGSYTVSTTGPVGPRALREFPDVSIDLASLA